MALKTGKRNKIIAHWKTGEFKSYTAIANHYKIDAKTAKKLLTGILQENTAVVEAGIAYENAKKSIKNPVEIRAVEKVVNERTKHEELIKNLTLKNATVLAKKIDGDLTMQEHKQAQETIHLAGKTLGVIKDKPEVAVQVNNTVNPDVPRRGIGDYYSDIDEA